MDTNTTTADTESIDGKLTRRPLHRIVSWRGWWPLILLTGYLASLARHDWLAAMGWSAAMIATFVPWLSKRLDDTAAS